MATTNNKFDAKLVPLEGTNLIEASAGTGKTYSIAILVLRILLTLDVEESRPGQEVKHRNISIKEILMVTFTKAAVAELEERVRRFIRTAYRVSQGEQPGDKSITDIVQAAIMEKGADEVHKRLHEAVIFLDEASVQTIHSFCQQMLREFAFETRQSFSVELVTDMTRKVDSEFNQFWRSQIAVMPLDILQLFGNMLSRENLKKVSKAYFEGKPIYGFDPEKDYLLDEAFYEQCRTRTKALQKQVEEIELAMLEYCKEKEALEAVCLANKHANNNLGEFVEDSEKFLAKFLAIYNASKPAYLSKFADLMALADQLAQIRSDIELALAELMHQIYAALLCFIGPAVNEYKVSHGQLCFDDLITQLHQRICLEDNPELIKSMQKKYRVVFIDEFQDTDRLQYEIFNTAFGTNTVVFYIGDPKQSIYAFRKADIDTYLKAGAQVGHKYGMHINYRSSDDFIRAMNGFFKPTADFDTFYYKDSEKGIEYHKVEAPEENKKGQFLLSGAEFPVINITEAKNAAEIVAALTAQIAELLSDGYRIAPIGADPRPVKPTDIGILVRANNDAIALKLKLSSLGIPSVVIGNAKILASVEAYELLYVLEAMLNPTRNAINKALLTSFTGISISEVLTQNDMITIERFGKYKMQWAKAGIYKALFSFIADYEIEPYLTSAATPGGERIISNLYQLIELLYKQQSTKNLSALELTSWLKRSIEDPSAEGDEYEQRIESDEDCVTIITVHKSKGLQFNIVLTSAMDLMGLNQQQQFLSFKNEKGEEQIAPKALIAEADLQALEQQIVQENRRMIYVALTRAVYGCFIYTSTDATRKKHFAVFDFLEAFKTVHPEGIRFIEPVLVPEGFRYRKAARAHSMRPLPVPENVHFELLNPDWRKLSYTYLAGPTLARGRYETRAIEKHYDQFVFQDLKRGNITGNLLHDIFEHIYFEQPAFWASAISKSVSRFAPHEREGYEPMLLTLVRNTTEAIINTTQTRFALKDTNFEKRLHEFEFDFPVNHFTRKDLINVIGDTATVNMMTMEGWEGMMNGKIDMLFEQEGKYYVLDWKSTYLGGGLEDYAPEKLELEMSRHNYHLQYLIYTVATVKFLQSRLDDFDYDRDFGGVIYYFVRGVRSGQQTGIYFAKPPEWLIAGLLVLWSQNGKALQA